MDALKALANAGKAAVTVATQMVGLLTGGSASPAASGLGPAGPGGGRPAMMPRVPMFRTTSVQGCGLYPFVVGGATPLEGVILGENLNGPGVVCADHMAWFERRIISAPSAMVMGLNGLGKSTLIRRIMLGLANRGIHSMILGDIKPDYVDAVEALGGQVVRIGHGLGGINPLDAGNVDEAVRLLADHPQERAALLQAAHERKKNLVISLVHIVRRQAPTDREEVILDAAVRILEERGGSPVLADLLEVVREAPPELRAAALDRGSMERYMDVTENLEASLMALLSGRLGGIFAAATTTPMMMDRSVVFDVSATRDESSDVQAAPLLATWSYGFATVEIAQVLADAGVAPRRHYNVIMDEMWRISRASPGLVDRIDVLTRTNRSVGVGQMLCTHSITDMDTLPNEEDRVKARGFVERSKMLFTAGVPPREMEMIATVFNLSQEEQALLRSWNAPGSLDPTSGGHVPPAGMGNFMLKTSDDPGFPFHLHLADSEVDINNTNKRWSMATDRGGETGAAA